MVVFRRFRARPRAAPAATIVGNHTDPFTKEWQIPYFTEKLTERSDGKIMVHPN